ncbi:hypothetical protein HPP92_000382 [Vanilla planifolia]|uniref:J domain-containing protein n=1 Tax=Vanilla planifolia TaxID=51239 RepID=A0A835RW45_VANPL|nr:hypothetical protein HPP92_000382 [Vanilla planifolia]
MRGALCCFCQDQWGKDWYAVLQLEMTADDSTIRKQYRKLALLLHPDKNKLPGAGGAFQLVGDAYKTLSDPAKRAQHDMFRGANFNRVFLNRAAQNSYKPSAKKQPGPGVSSTAVKTSFAHFSGLNHSQPSHVSNSQVFWTMCPSCSARIQYYENVLVKEVCCHKCFNRFVASDLTGNAVKDGNATPFTHQRSDKASSVGPQEAKSGDSVFQPLSKPEPCSTSERDVVHDVDGDLNRCNGMKYEKVQLQPTRREQETNAPDWNARQNCANNLDRTAELNFGKAPNPLRRSKRRRQNVSYCEVEGKVIDMDSVPVASKRTRQGDKLAKKNAKK